MTLPPLSEEELDALLVSGDREAELRDSFGDPLYEELRHLARQDQATRSTRKSHSGQVFILPGIMGSKLSVREPRDTDLIWLNPLALRKGRISELKYPDSHDIFASGIFHFAYTRMRLALQLKGYKVQHIPFDWRHSVPDIANKISPLIEQATGPVSLICHSMGGLVGRALAAGNREKIRNVITLGTPNRGSYAPVTVLRGLHKNVHLLARLDKTHSPKQLVDQVMCRLPGLLEMLPSPDARPAEHWFKTDFWPSGTSLAPGDALALAGTAQSDLPPPDDRFTQIIGLGHETLRGVKIDSDSMEFTSDTDGDGTVPRDLAEMDGAANRYYVEGEHGGLCNQSLLIKACDDILSGRKPSLATTPDALSRRTTPKTHDEKTLRSAARSGLPREADAPDAVSDAALLEGFLAATADLQPIQPAPEPPVPTPQPEPEPQTHVYTRQRTALRRININVMNADILDVPADAYVFGIFEGVTTLGGAIGAVDHELGGILSALLADGQISGRKGEVSFIPIPRHHLRTSHVVIVGLGPFGPEDTILSAVRVAGRNLMRSLCISEVASFASILPGAGSGPAPVKIFQALFTGIFEALEDWDEDQSFSCIRICEFDKDRYTGIVRSLNKTFADVNMPDCEIVVQEKPAPAARGPRRNAPRQRQPLPDIFTVRAEITGVETANPRIALFLHHVSGSGRTRASVQTSEAHFGLNDLTTRMEPLSKSPSPDQLPKIADEIEHLILHRDFLDAFEYDHNSGYGLQIICDAWASRIPWEVLHLGGPPIALNGGISRWYLPAAAGVSRSARRPLQVRSARDIRMLLVSDPTENLRGARAEAEAIKSTLLGHDGFALRTKSGAEATLHAVTELLGCSDSDKLFDVFHYAGHAFFEATDRARSGLVLAGNQYLHGTDIAQMAQVPGFVFLNACESGRVRKAPDPDAAEPTPQDFAARNSGLAEAFLLAGVRHLVGTFWPVYDDTALQFSSMFYEGIRNETIGAALTRARRDVNAKGSAEWVNYIHYGAANDRI